MDKVCKSTFKFRINKHIQTYIASTSSFAAVREIKTRTEVSINLSPDDIYHLEVLNAFHTDEEWMDYHSQIIQREGYDTSDDSNLYAFTMYDYKYDKDQYFAKYGFDDDTFADLGSLKPEHFGHIEHGNHGRTPRPTMNRTPRPSRVPKKDIPHTRPPRPTFDRTARPTQPTVLATPKPTRKRSAKPTAPAQTSAPLSVGGMTWYV